MDRRESERLLDAIHRARAAGEPAAMATVVRVKGSAYRREGTRMFVRRNGTYECSLSGGCLEPTVAEAAALVIATGDPVIVSYDLAEDSIWGLGIGCSGAVDIRIERIGDDAITNDWLTILERGEAAVLVTPLSGVSGRMIVRGPGDVVGGFTDPIVEQRAIASARRRLAAPYPASGPESIGGAEVFFDVRFTSPGSSQSHVSLNWQKGPKSSHAVSAGIAPGVWTITGVRAHEVEADHTGSFFPVLATITVSP
jgi:xanthine/CO dehydrogenase XdhC/CoxF family maturation factor